MRAPGPPRPLLRHLRRGDDRASGSRRPLTPPKARRSLRAAVTSPADEPLLAALKQWRLRASDGKPAYTVAHNSTLESIAALKPSSLEELASVRGVGPSFVKRHGEQVLTLVAGA